MKEIAYSHSFKNLYLIGNGFDIHHRIRCKYPDFQKWLHERNPVLENRLFQVYDLHLGNLWSSLEDNLGEITPEAILDNSVYGPMVMILTDILRIPLQMYTSKRHQMYSVERCQMYI